MFNPKDSDPHFHFPRQCFWLKINGSWPLKSTKTPATQQRGNRWSSAARSHSYLPVEFLNFDFFYNIWSWYIICSVGITILYQTAFLIATFGDIIKTTENCCTTFMGALNFVRLFHLHQNRAQFKDIIEQFVKDIWIVKNTHPDIERDCKKNMKTFNIMTILLSCLILMYCALPLIEVLLSEEGFSSQQKPFPYKMIFPYDAQNGWRYVFTYIFTSYAGVCVVTTLFAEDSIFGFFVTYSCAQFRILHESIDALMLDAHAEVLKQHGEHQVTVSDFQLEYTKRLNQIAYRHNRLIQFANRLEHFFSPILLLNFSISSVLICMVGFQLVTGKDMFIGDYVKFIVYISSSLSQLYIMCYNGDTLIQQSTETAKHLYACNWEGGKVTRKLNLEDPTRWKRLYKLAKNNQDGGFINVFPPADKTFRLNLEIMILCSQRPVHITALRFSTLSLQSFTAILSTSMSYFTLLQSVYNKGG